MDRSDLVSTYAAYKDLHNYVGNLARVHPVVHRHPAALMALLGVVAEAISQACNEASTPIDSDEMAQVATYLRTLRAVSTPRK